MKTKHWIILVVVAAAAVGALWWWVIRPRVVAKTAGTAKARADASREVGSYLGPDASGFAIPDVLSLVPGLGAVDWTRGS